MKKQKNLPKQRESRFTTHRTLRGAPHQAVTVEDAVGDLPLFEIQRPKISEIPLSKQRDEELRNRKGKLAQYHVTNPWERGWIGVKEQAYRSNPMSEFQRRCRIGAQKLTYHICRSGHPGTIERIWHVHFGAESDRRALPDELQFTRTARARADRRFARIDREGQFEACCTECSPARDMAVLLPDQNRQLSIRENLRSQSIPDWYVFADDCQISDMQRIVGNAVPPCTL